jgi:hypothetical protein
MDKLTYHPGMLGDWVSAANTVSGQLAEAKSRCDAIVAGVVTPEHDQGDAAAAASEIMAQIALGIQAGSDVISRHGSTVDNATANFLAQDAHGASGMRGI